MTKSNHEEAFLVMASFPEGLTSFEFEQLMETAADKRCASARLSQFVKEGLAEKRGHRLNESTGQHCVVYAPTGRAFQDRVLEDRDPRRKRKRPTYNELIELRKLKANAIARYPELGIDPIILRARQQVSEILRGEGNEAKAALVERGELDGGETMRIVLAVLKGTQ